jgi:hypothetical protein
MKLAGRPPIGWKALRNLIRTQSLANWEPDIPRCLRVMLSRPRFTLPDVAAALGATPEELQTVIDGHAPLDIYFVDKVSRLANAVSVPIEQVRRPPVDIPIHYAQLHNQIFKTKQ